MLYDLAQAPPESGSLQESVFLILTKRRMEAEALKTRVLVEAALAPHVEGKSQLADLFSDYLETVFPFFKSTKGSSEDLMKKALDHWTSKQALRVRPVMAPTRKTAQFKSALQRGKERVAEKERLRKSGQLKRVE